jgi:hypothetical protein
MKRSKSVITLFLIITLPTLLMFTSCPNKNNIDSVNQAQVDFEITSTIKEEFVEQNISIEIQVRTEGSKVTLTGTARSNEEKEKAVGIAENTKVAVEGKEYRVKEVDASRLEIKK